MQVSIKDILAKIVQTDWNDDNELHADTYSVRLFSPTTISSSFECFEVHIDKRSVDTDEYGLPEVFVVKIGQEKVDREGEILEELYRNGLSVPKVYGRIVMRNSHASINIILEEFIPGATLFEERSRENWLKLATALADFHKGFWNKNTGVVSPKIRNRVKAASWFCERYRQYETACKRAVVIVGKSSRTFLHGDLVPTNVMFFGEQVKFIDLNDGGTDPYVLDIARAISCVDPVTIERFCPCPEEFCEAYYFVLKDQFGSFEKYQQDVRAAEFLECAALAYGAVSSGITGTTEKAYANYMIARLKELATAIV